MVLRTTAPQNSSDFHKKALLCPVSAWCYMTRQLLIASVIGAVDRLLIAINGSFPSGDASHSRGRRDERIHMRLLQRSGRHPRTSLGGFDGDGPYCFVQFIHEGHGISGGC